MLPSTRDPHPGVFRTAASQRQLDPTVVKDREAGGHPFGADTSVEVSPTPGVGEAGTDDGTRLVRLDAAQIEAMHGGGIDDLLHCTLAVLGGTRLRKRRKAIQCSGGRRR